MTALEQNQPATIQDANKAISDGCLTRHFLAHGGSPDTIVNAIASTQRKTQLLLNPLASSLHRFFKLPGSYVGCGNQLVGVWPKFFPQKYLL